MQFRPMMEDSGASNSTSKIQDYVNEIYKTRKFEEYFDQDSQKLVKKWNLKPNFDQADRLIEIAKEHATQWNSKVSQLCLGLESNWHSLEIYSIQYRQFTLKLPLLKLSISYSRK